MKNAFIALPPLATQRRIARFLDEKTAWIDELIVKKRTLLDLLAEKRQALITRAVTKGLEPGDSMLRDPDQEELLDLQTVAPAQRDRRIAEGVGGMIFGSTQETQRLKWVFSSHKSGAWGTEPDGESDVVCIRAADFDGKLGRLNDRERTLRSVDPETYGKLALHRGDIILEKSGGGKKQLVGRAAIYDSDEPSITSNFLAWCRPASGTSPSYVNYLLLVIYNGRGTFPHLKQSTGIQNLDLSSFLDIRVWLPPLAMQRRIARFLDEQTTQIDKLQSLIVQSVDKLAEYRSALITAAVTGQITDL